MRIVKGVLFLIAMFTFATAFSYQAYSENTYWKIKTIAYSLDDTFWSFIRIGGGVGLFFMFCVMFLMIAFSFNLLRKAS